MKIEEERAKLLSNFEILEHLKEIQQQNNWRATDKKFKRSFNPDLEVITKDLSSYLSKTPAQTQTADKITQCMKDLSKYQLEKIEKLQIINSTPYSLVNLYAVIEECDQRFSEDEINDLLEIIHCHFPQQEAEQIEEDVEMEQ
jgi:hypothetical protein